MACFCVCFLQLCACMKLCSLDLLSRSINPTCLFVCFSWCVVVFVWSSRVCVFSVCVCVFHYSYWSCLYLFFVSSFLSVCVSSGEGGAGNYVKMIHNGIEYGDMQLIAEAYDVLKNVGGLTNDEIQKTFAGNSTSQPQSEQTPIQRSEQVNKTRYEKDYKIVVTNLKMFSITIYMLFTKSYLYSITFFSVLCLINLCLLCISVLFYFHLVPVFLVSCVLLFPPPPALPPPYSRLERRRAAVFPHRNHRSNFHEEGRTRSVRRGLHSRQDRKQGDGKVDRAGGGRTQHTRTHHHGSIGREIHCIPQGPQSYCFQAVYW